MFRRLFRAGLWRGWYILAVVCYVQSCQTETGVTRSFCYWKTSFDLSNTEDSLLNCLKVHHLYLRLFDVDWNPYDKEAQPVGSINRWWNGKLNLNEVTPTVFITNTVMEKSSESELDTLAVRIKDRMNMILADYANAFANNLVNNYNRNHDYDYHRSQQISDSILPIGRQQFSKHVLPELLIDCDWSEGSRDKFFYFLNQLKKYLPDYELSVTLRLWQFKYRDKAGIPPANRCLLMCYNMQSPANYEANNSIGSQHEISRYITQSTYPVTLDVALPLFDWAVLYRGQTYKGLISDNWLHDNIQDTSLLKKVAPNRYLFATDKVIGNNYVRYGDELRLEQVSPDELAHMVQYLKKHLTLTPNARVTFFAWDTAYIHHYGIENLTKYYRSLRN